MKEGIHPSYKEVSVECACGNKFVTRSTLTRIRLEICSNCHPFYTGRQKLLDTAGRVERFEKRFAKTGGKTIVRKPAERKAAAPKVPTKVKKILKNTPRAAPPEKRGGEGRSPKPSKSPAR
jgi:large subunit ribosomal protein L31